MQFVIACVCIFILAKVVHNQPGCSYVPGEMKRDTKDSRHIDCHNKSFVYYECDHLSAKVLKIQNCPTESIESNYSAFRNARIMDIFFSNYTTLRYLHLNFQKLKQFNVSFNELTEIHDYLFYKTNQLSDVDFSHNQIKVFYASIFSKVPKLTMINISHNQIEEYTAIQ